MSETAGDPLTPKVGTWVMFLAQIPVELSVRELAGPRVYVTTLGEADPSDDVIRARFADGAESLIEHLAHLREQSA